MERRNAAVALLGFIGTYYILDFDYPQNHEVGLTILYLFFQDTRIPGHILHPLKSAPDKYNTYKSTD